MKLIELTRGLETLVDDDTFAWASKYRWYAQQAGKRFYAGRRDKFGRTVLLHREILNIVERRVEVDHINRNSLDNRRINLRKATPHQQRGNAKKRCDGVTSRFRGVSWSVLHLRWRADIHEKGHHKFLGCFHNEKDAARAYDCRAIKIFGEFANTNFPNIIKINKQKSKRKNVKV